jgi:hypothetical protein
MTKRIILPIGIALFILFILGCGNNRFPKTGDLYFKTLYEGKPEYIHMRFDDKRMDGKIYTEDGVDGSVFYCFFGEITSDSTLQVSTVLPYDTLSEEWIYRLKGSSLSLKNYFDRTEWVHYEAIDKSQMPDTSLVLYASVQDILMEHEGEYWENFFLGCYEASSIEYDSSGTPLFKEYIQFNWREVAGTGFGMDGNSRWVFKFKGIMLNDSVLEMQVKYNQTGKPLFTTSETWVIDEEKNQMRLLGDVNGRPGSKKYSSCDCAKETYFESISPNPEKKTTLYEYIKIFNKDNMVWGIGGGDFMEGSEPWTISFGGLLDDENKMKLEVNYTPDVKAPFTETETWVLDIGNNRLYRPDWAKSNNELGASEYGKPLEINNHYLETVNGEREP